jgi:hypothetical protein
MAYQTNTDDTGYFNISSADPDIAVMPISENLYSAVFYTDGSFNPGSGETGYYYSHAVAVTSNIDFEDISIPPEYTMLGDTLWNKAAAFNIGNIIRNGHNSFGYMMWDNVPVYFDDIDTISESSFGFFQSNGVAGIIIKGRGNATPPYPNDWDQWDSTVILHEYGHAFMDQNAEFPPFDPDANNDHFYFMSPLDSLLKLALVEAFAEFYSGVANNTISLTNHDNFMALITVINIEQPYPDVPYASSLRPNSPPAPYPLYNGVKVEGAIVESLWDLYDYYDDGNYYAGADLWGHNNDFNSGPGWYGLSNIMNVILCFDPRPDSSEHDFCWTIYEFIWGWFDSGFPFDTIFANIFDAHNVPVFIPGDMSGDYRINILDITFLVVYLYKGGPAPVPKVTADVNADCSIDIIDITYMINYIYRDGPKPFLGCSIYYP